jgi:preprotein translocase subunit YajC
MISTPARAASRALSVFASASLALLAASPALAQQAAGGAAGQGGLLGGPWGSLVMFVPIIILFYFLIWRPQAKRAKDHQTLVSGLKRGDTVVLPSGVIGKVTRIEDQEAMVEIATGVNVRVVKSMITEVRTRGEPAKAAPAAKSASKSSS